MDFQKLSESEIGERIIGNEDPKAVVGKIVKSIRQALVGWGVPGEFGSLSGVLSYIESHAQYPALRLQRERQLRESFDEAKAANAKVASLSADLKNARLDALTLSERLEALERQLRWRGDLQVISLLEGLCEAWPDDANLCVKELQDSLTYLEELQGRVNDEG